MLFLSLVAVPLLKSDPDSAETQRRFLSMARRFRTFAWGAIFVLLFSGTILLQGHVSFRESIFDWPVTVLVKLLLVVILLGISVTHEFLLGPKVTNIKQKPFPSWSTAEQRFVKISPWLSRLVLIFGLAIFLLAVVLARS
ncbi:MAG: CopD family protein [Nitrospirales bacterium]|nr:CopD family protein [Nitrospirales bacterium]